ncbi:MAG: hypothetical protein JWO85_2646 [Candidatus Eremiobacteraeota bacterium]|nr:hypothetical protein [Candidatus Eremiobacteraeota bacterium]
MSAQPTQRKRTPTKPNVRAVKVLNRIVAHVSAKGYWPSAPEIQADLGVRAGSRATVWRSLKALDNAGLVTMQRSRAWSITGDGWGHLGMPPIAPRHDGKPRKKTHKQKLASTREQRTLRRLDAFKVYDQAKTTAAPWVTHAEPPPADETLEIIE